MTWSILFKAYLFIEILNHVFEVFIYLFILLSSNKKKPKTEKEKKKIKVILRCRAHCI